MNLKTAKRLRRECGYKMKNHPRGKRIYLHKKNGTIELDDTDPRCVYRESKKEYKALGGSR